MDLQGYFLFFNYKSLTIYSCFDFFFILVNQGLSKAGRQPKRKFPGSDSGPSGKKGRLGNDSNTVLKLPAHGYPLEHPFNKVF